MDLPSNDTDPTVAQEVDDLLPPGSFDSRTELILIIGIVMTVLTAFFSSLRIYVRAVMIKKWGSDDTLLVFALFAVIMHNSIVCLATRFGLGKHTWMSSQKALSTLARLSLFVTIVYQVAFITIKITFLLQYRRVFPTLKVERICNIGIGFLVLFGVSALISCGVTYHMIYKYTYWDSTVSLMGWWIANAAIHLVTDLLIFIIPIPLLCRLRTTKLQKVALTACFGLGLLTCAIPIIRIVILPGSYETADQTYDDTPIVIWSVVELTTAVICCCIPTLKPLSRPSKYSARASSCTTSGSTAFLAHPRPPKPPRCARERTSSPMSTESEIFMRKPSSTFFWRRGSRMSDTTMLAGGDEIEPVPVSALLRTPTIPVTLITPASTPTVVQMPVLEVRRPSDSTVNSADAPRERRSIRLSLRSDEVLNLGGGLRHDMSARRHMSLALTERDSDDDTCYFGVAEEDVEAECSTPLSPPPKGQQFTDSP